MKKNIVKTKIVFKKHLRYCSLQKNVIFNNLVLNISQLKVDLIYFYIFVREFRYCFHFSIYGVHNLSLINKFTFCFVVFMSQCQLQ